MALGDTLIVSDLSRLGRNMVEVMSVLDMLIKKGCKVQCSKRWLQTGSVIIIQDTQHGAADGCWD
jgi:DNA invertase Pin-like site-specific DNA recombinase